MMSRATIIDERPDEVDTTLPEEPAIEAAEAPVEEEPQASEVPDKYQGESVEELIQMHQELEKFSGKQRNEVGEDRKSTRLNSSHT